MSFEKFEPVKLFRLDINDRFYYADDKQMRVYQVVKKQKDVIQIKRDNQLHPKPVRQNKDVVFLRNENN